MRSNWEVIYGLETGNLLLDNLSKLSNSFYSGGLVDVFIFAAVLYAYCLLQKSEARPDILTLLLSFVFSGLYLLCANLWNMDFFTANAYQLCLSALCFVGHAAFFYPALRFLSLFMEKAGNKDEKPISHPIAKGAAIIFLCWLPYLLMNFPGSFCVDSVTQFSQVLGLSEWSAHHPPLSTGIMGLCFSLGQLFGSANLGVFLYILLQSVCGAFIFSYSITTLYRMGLSRRAWWIMLLFFALSPFWGSYAQWFEKDLLYAELFTLTVSLLLPVIKYRRCSAKEALCISAAALTAVLLRKTGLYELIPLLLVLALWLRKKDRVRLLSAAVCVLLLSLAVNNLLYPLLGIKDASVREALSIPFQQTACYVNRYPDEVTEDERAAIDAVLVYDQLGIYDETISDPIKNLYRDDGSALPEYFKVWFKMFFKHPGCYFDSALKLSFGYLAPVSVSLDAYIMYEYPDSLVQAGIQRVIPASFTRLFDCIRAAFMAMPLTDLMCTAGLYTWILMACFVQLLRRREYSALMLLIPGFMNLLLCIASPLSNSTRYALPLIAIAPLLIGWTILHSRAKE